MIQNQPQELFPVGSIFTVDHILDMQTLQKLFSLESNRKSSLCRHLLHSDSDYLVDDPIPGSNTSLSLLDLTIKTIEKWPDECEESFINVNLGTNIYKVIV